MATQDYQKANQFVNFNHHLSFCCWPSAITSGFARTMGSIICWGFSCIGCEARCWLLIAHQQIVTINV